MPGGRTKLLSGALVAMAWAVAAKDIAAACYADPARLSNMMAVIVASYKCPGFDRALFGAPRDTFIQRAEVIDQMTGACEPERTLAMNAATEKMLSGREAFCSEVEAALASDAKLAQALVQAGVRAP